MFFDESISVGYFCRYTKDKSVSFYKLLEDDGRIDEVRITGTKMNLDYSKKFNL